MTKAQNQSGYIALMSAIIISAVLVIISVSVSTTGFFSRFNVLESEYKQRSSALAQGCIDAALLQLAQDPSNINPSTVSIGADSCSIISIQSNTPALGQTTIQTKASFNQAVSNFQIIVSTTNLSLISWQELPTL